MPSPEHANAIFLQPPKPKKKPESSPNVEIDAGYTDAVETAGKSGAVQQVVARDLEAARLHLKERMDDLETFSKNPEGYMMSRTMIVSPETQGANMLKDKEAEVARSAADIEGLFFVSNRLQHEPDPGRVAEELTAKIAVLEHDAAQVPADSAAAENVGAELKRHRTAKRLLDGIITRAKSN